MAKEIHWGAVGVGATLVGTGVALILTTSLIEARVAGTALTVIGFVLPVVVWVRESFLSDREKLAVETRQAVDRLQTSTQAVLAQFEEGVTALSSTISRIGVRNDARFLPNGFIGLQAQSLMLDEDSGVGRDRVRMAILGHLPSHMRLQHLSVERGSLLYENWEPPHLITEYVDLVNRRSAALKRFLESGGIVREIYDQVKLSQYVEHGYTFHDKVVDPREEIVDRLNALLYYLTLPNYYVSLLGDQEDRPGPYFLLKQGVGLVVDLRTTETQRHFTRSLDALYTDAPKALEGFEEKFQLTWRNTDRDQAKVFLGNLVHQLSVPRAGTT